MFNRIISFGNLYVSTPFQQKKYMAIHLIENRSSCNSKLIKRIGPDFYVFSLYFANKLYMAISS
jgi:hypothetical protein